MKRDVGTPAPRTMKRRYNGEQLEMTIANDVARAWYGSDDDLYLHELEWCKSRIRPGCMIVDCGAHHGLMTMSFARWAGPRGMVIAYEPIPENVDVLRANLRLNSVANVVIRPFGLGASNERRFIGVNGGNGVVTADAGPLEVPIVRLDDDLDPRIRVDLLKVDVEGSDLDMLRGAQRILAQRPLIALELHNFLFSDRGGTLGHIFDLLDTRHWQYEVQPQISDTATVAIEGRMDLQWLAQFDNPHVFCRPRQSVLRRMLRRYG